MKEEGRPREFCYNNWCCSISVFLQLFFIVKENELTFSTQLSQSGELVQLLKDDAMGLFNLFKKPTLIQDDFFGQLRFMDFKDSSKNYFEGKGLFKPTNNETEYLIQGDLEGPTEAQKEFYIKLQNNFEQYVQKMKPLIEDEFRNWKEDFQINDFNNEFNLVCINIPRLD